jgi:stage II sporulation protein D
VTSIPLGGVTLTGGQVRELFSLRSASFTVVWDGNAFIFAVTGYGHGVGMSQYGANALASAGMEFRAILTWYYTGTEIDTLW